MKIRFSNKPLLILLLLFIIPGSVLAYQADIPEGTDQPLPGNAPWIIETIVDSPNFVYSGRYASLDLDPTHGYPAISYYNATDKDPYYARRVGSGGNCGEKNNWQCWEALGFSDVGQFSSLALGKPGASRSVYGWPYIASYNAEYNALEIQYIDDTGKWVYERIDTEPKGMIGYYPSLDLDSNDTPHISYYNKKDGNPFGQVYYATRANPKNSGNCGGILKDWQCDPVDTSFNLDIRSSLHISAGDNPSIAYFGGSRDLMFANKGGGLYNCGIGNTWSCQTVDSNGDVGMYPSFIRDVNTGTPHIAYYDATNDTLKYAKFVLSGGNCGDYNSWQCDTIDTMGSSVTDMGISLALDPDGYPVIAYQQTSEYGPSVLKIARPAHRLDIQAGNCGPQDLFYTWQCETIDDASANTNVGNYLDLAVNSGGLAIIAYYESDSYHYSGNLKIAYQLLNLYLPITLNNYTE